MKEGFQIGVKGGTGGKGSQGGVTGKEQKKQTGIISRGVGILALIGAVMKSMQPVVDITQAVLAQIFLWILKLVRWAAGVIPKVKDFFEKLKEKLLGVGETIGQKIAAMKDKVVEWLRAGWEFIKQLPLNIWNLLQQGFNFVKDKVIALREKLVEAFQNLKESFMDLMSSLKERIVEFRNKAIERLGVLRNKLIEIRDNIKEKLKEWIDLGKDKLTQMVDSLRTLPERIWNFMKDLPRLIGEFIGNALSSISPFSGRRTESVGDAIIRPNGQVIKTDPKDTIIATKNPGGTGSSITNNFYGVMPQDFIDEVKRQLAIDINKSSRF